MDDLQQFQPVNANVCALTKHAARERSRARNQLGIQPDGQNYCRLEAIICGIAIIASTSISIIWIVESIIAIRILR